MATTGGEPLWPWRDWTTTKPWWEHRLDLTPTVLQVSRGDVHAFDYDWHFTNHDTGDEDRSER